MFESETTETVTDYRVIALSLAAELIKSGLPTTTGGSSSEDLRDATLIIAKEFLAFLTEQTND